MQIQSRIRQVFSTATAIFCFAGSTMASNAQDQSASPPPLNQAPTASSMPTDVDPNSPLAQVIRLAQSGVEESVILAYINSSAAPFNLTPDQIIYLKDLGLPSEATTAMIQHDQQLGAAAPAPVVQPAPAPAPTTAPVVTTEQPVQVTQNYFYDTLSPYGGWVNIDGYGLCWQPTVVIYNSSWQPYCDHGHWVNTDSGWYWLSDYSWGATAFHYGRWFRDSRRGWCWWPETTWAPSWVTWRNTPANDYCGWAPLPPRTYYRAGAGIVFNGAVVTAGFDFGLNVNCFTFVPTRNFCDPHPYRYRAPQTQVVQIYNHTTAINNFNVNSRDKTIVNVGIAPERITAVTRQPIPRVTLRDSATPVARGAQLNKDVLIVNRPRISETTVTTLNQGIKPPVVRQNPPPRSLVVNGNDSRQQNPIFRQNNPPAQNYNSSSAQYRQTIQPPSRNNYSANSPGSAVQVQHPVATEKIAPENQPSQNTIASPNNASRYISPRQQSLEQQSHSAPYNPNTQPSPAPQHSQSGGQSGGSHAGYSSPPSQPQQSQSQKNH